MARYWNLELEPDGTAQLLFDTPDAAVNVLSSAAIADLCARLDELAATRHTGLIIRSAKKSGFIAGADIKEFTTIRTPAEGLRLVLAGQEALRRIEDLSVPTVAAIHGFALGGGLELALACTYRIGAADGRLSLGLPEVRLGIHPGFGGTVRSVRILGVRAAMELMLQGKPWDAKKALAAGLLDRTAPAAELVDAAKSLLAGRPPRRTAPFGDRLLALPLLRPIIARRLDARLSGRVARDHYPAPYAIVELWRRHAADPRTGYAAEARSIGALMCSPSSRNLVRVFLLQDRLKNPGGKAGHEVRRVHVIGAGTMGGDIAAWSALRGLDVTLQDLGDEVLAAARMRAQALFDKRIKDPEAASLAAARLRLDADGAGVEDADLVIEAIGEDPDAKRALYAALEPRLKPRAILATNTSSIALETLGARLADPSRLVGLHFFNPVAQMQLVEIVAGAATRPDVAAAAAAFARRLDKLPLACRSAPGFAVNRILVPYLNEAIFAYEEGIPAELIDAVGLGFGMPTGPIELVDVIGLDVALQVGRVLAGAFGRRVPQVLVDLVAAGKFGRKSGQGFYTWTAGKALRNPGPVPRTPEDLEDRLILPMVNEAVAVLREGIVDDADLVDGAAIFGTGFAPFRGGPIAYARARGTEAVRARLEELALRHGERFRPDAGWDGTAL